MELRKLQVMVEGIFHFRSPGLWMPLANLGAAIRFERDQQTIQIKLPRDGDDFDLGLSARGLEGMAAFRSRLGPEGSHQLVSVDILEVTVADDRLNAPIASEMAQELSGIATTVCREFIDLMRSRYGQFWLPLSDQHPTTVGDFRLVDDERSGMWGSPYVGEPILMHEEVDAPTPEELTVLQDEFAAGSFEDRQADVLLADAQHLRTRTWQPDFRRAVLLAAIACEVKVQATLRLVAPGNTEAMLEVILSPQRPVPLSMRHLLHEVCRALTDRSFRAEEPHTYKTLNAFFALRNEVAHRGRLPTYEETHEGVEAVVALFGWLETLSETAR